MAAGFCVRSSKVLMRRSSWEEATGFRCRRHCVTRRKAVADRSRLWTIDWRRKGIRAGMGCSVWHGEWRTDGRSIVWRGQDANTQLGATVHVGAAVEHVSGFSRATHTPKVQQSRAVVGALIAVGTHKLDADELLREDEHETHVGFGGCGRQASDQHTHRRRGNGRLIVKVGRAHVAGVRRGLGMVKRDPLRR